jgi:CBS-domain-containing membrane protein
MLSNFRRQLRPWSPPYLHRTLKQLIAREVGVATGGVPLVLKAERMMNRRPTVRLDKPPGPADLLLRAVPLCPLALPRHLHRHHPSLRKPLEAF